MTAPTHPAHAAHAEPRLRTCLWFARKDAREAAEFYASVFPDTHVDGVQDSAADNPSVSAGEELVVEFTLLGQPFMGLNGGDGPGGRPNESVSFVVTTAGQAETDHYWDALVDSGGAESMCGWCTDRWGFSWQITPVELLDGLADPDPEAARRVMEAMLGMRRIDVAAVEAARRGPAPDSSTRE
ncbi:VOC family protein [Nocardioidaceae bacterium]|nr:VOC family protein [Nocardioidaceae bacterium]